MNTSFFAVLPLAMLTLVGSLPAQQAPALSGSESVPAANTSTLMKDGITFYQGQPYLVRNGRAEVINEQLVPNGQLLTMDGRFIPLPADFTSHIPTFNQAGAPQTPAQTGSDANQTINWYRPVGAVGPQSGVPTLPGTTAAHITNGATRASGAIPAGSTTAKTVGTPEPSMGGGPVPAGGKNSGSSFGNAGR